MPRSAMTAMLALAVGAVPFACGAAQPLGASTVSAPVGMLVEVSPGGSSSDQAELLTPGVVDAGLLPPPEGRQLPEGGSLRPEDSSLLPEAAGLPDALTPPMVGDASIPEVHPVPLPVSGLP